MRRYFHFIYVITLMVALAPASLHADLGEQTLDVCDCPEIEQLSSDMREILEEAYANQGEIPPFSFDQFTVSLAIQVQAETPSGCLESILESPENLLAQLPTEIPSENPMPRHLVLDARGRVVTDATLMSYREAALEGRYVVIRAEINGELQTFLLQRNEDGEVTVTNYRPSPVVMGFEIDPTRDYDHPLINPLTPRQELPETSVTIQTQTPATTWLDPRTGEEFVQARYQFERRSTGPRHELTYTGFLEGNEPQDVLTVGAGATLSYDIDGTYLNEEGELSRTGEAMSGHDLELRVSAQERRFMSTGELFERDLSYGATLFGDDNRALSFDIDHGLYGDPTYDLEYGNAGRHGQDIEAVIGGLTIARPQAGTSGAPMAPMVTGGQPGPSAGKGGGPAPLAPGPGLEFGAGPAERGPLNQDLFHLGVGGTIGESPTELSFSHATTEGTSTRYLAVARSLDEDRTSLRLGAGDEDSRLNFNLEDNPHMTSASLLRQWQGETPTDEDTEVTHTLGLSYQERAFQQGVSTLSYDRETLETDTLQLEGDVTLRESERRVLSAQATTEGTLTLSFDSSLTRDYSMPIPLRDEDDRPIEGTRPYQFGTYERSYGGALEILEDGYSVSGAFSEEFGSLPNPETGEMARTLGYSIDLSLAEENDQVRTVAELTLMDSEGFLGSPCETVSLGHYTNENPGANPARQIDVHDFNSYGQLVDGTNCGVHVQRTGGLDHYMATFRHVDVRDFDPSDQTREFVHVRQMAVGTRPSGESYGAVGVGWQMNFSSGAFLRR